MKSRLPLIALLLSAAAAHASGVSSVIDYFIYDDVYDEKLPRDRIRFGVGGGPDGAVDAVQPFAAGYERDIAGKVSGGATVAGGWVHGFSASLQAITRFRRDKRFRPLLYAGPTFAAGASSETWTLCSCDVPGPYSDADPPYYGKAHRTTHPSLFATGGVGLQIRVWRGIGVEILFGRHVKLLGKGADIESTPELAAAAKEYFSWEMSPYSAFAGYFYEF